MTTDPKNTPGQSDKGGMSGGGKPGQGGDKDSWKEGGEMDHGAKPGQSGKTGEGDKPGSSSGGKH
jgi:hypothetical protein